MTFFLSQIFIDNWRQKTIAVLAAILVWFFVNQSITETKTLTSVPVRVLNLPADKTIVGLLPNGYLSQRITLSLSGSKDVIQEIEPGDLEVHLDAASATSDDWVVQITKKNIASLNPMLDLKHHITLVSHPDFVVKFSKLVTEKIPIYVRTPTGSAPEGYEFLDISPEKLTQTLSGPKEEMQELKIKGLKLTIDMNRITKAELDLLKQQKKPGHDDEVSFIIPEKWKQVAIPFRHNVPQEINDPEAKGLRIDFLRKKLLPIGKEVAIAPYYPLRNVTALNPTNSRIRASELIRREMGLTTYSRPLYVRDVSRLFLDHIRDYIQIVVVVVPKSEGEFLQWSLEVIDPKELEESYVQKVLAEQKEVGMDSSEIRRHQDTLRKRFGDYIRKLALYTSDGKRLSLRCTLQGEEILVMQVEE